MNFKEYIELHRAEVYSKICEYVKVKEPTGHYGIMRDYIDRQGSYRRPGLVMLTGQMFGAKLSDLVLPAAAEQLSEDWILMQDDVEDDSELRRGKPAAQRLHGWVHAMNATNSGQMSMWKMLKDYLLQVGEKKGNRLYEKFYEMIAYTVEGQYVENMFIHNTKDLRKASENLYYRILDSKTCFYTVYGPMQLGAIAADQPDNVLEMLREIGTNAGIAFQIVDDILDMTADEKVFGKRNFGDLYEGKLTLMILHTYEKATPEERDRIDAIYRKARESKTREEIDFLRSMIAKYGGLEYAEEKAKHYGRKATETIEHYRGMLPDNEYTKIMLSAIEELYVRKK
ncbi:MAG: polyprenyl synthetase family protein [Candidatus Micrarchaeota archaeon]|nr:polyprenyl synthetase family protein [Candidatus Micrarchaeota archaeon]MDE1804613.1 polyprenyl synthetase family protein [Candidatus Micrarchaeota archaeon]MDE1846461.1 polyprenyl synthetase family protein [Candidatus Micrarchaeota archaeon]